ncbi:MAG: hypothetical protein HY928_10970 [Elusimicrobia bacterium]|nr:hypothetical protein [Elusimicrobiota bacterium]
MHLLLAFLLCLPGALRAATGVISVDPGEPGYANPEETPAASAKGKKNKKSKKEKPPAGDTLIGSHIQTPAPKPEAAPERKAPKAGLAPAGSRVPGIYAVYQAAGRWMLIDRDGKKGLQAGSNLVVIGSHGLGQFQIERSSRTYSAACEGSRPVARRAWLLGGKDAKAFKQVGTPVIAILLKPGAAFDSRRARFTALKNEVSEPLYKKLDASLRAAVAADLGAGVFQMDLGDEEGHKTASKPDPEKIRLKIDFAARLKLDGLQDGTILVEGAEYSRSYRRCLRMVDGGSPVGPCVEMPHELMAETAALEFVAYDPARSGRPFLLAFTEKAPLWGDERWGFQTTPEGPKLFLRDALDPRCRDAF